LRRRHRPRRPIEVIAVAFAFLAVIPKGNLLPAFAVAVAFLAVIPEGNLLPAFAVAVAFLAVIPEGNLLPAFAVAVASLAVIPKGNLLLALAAAVAFLAVIPEGNLLLALAAAVAFLAVIPGGNLLFPRHRLRLEHAIPLRRLWPFKQTRKQIIPRRILSLNQLNLLRARPLLQLLLPGNGAAHIPVVLEVHQPMDGVTLRMASRNALTMRRGATSQIVRHADIEVSGAA
jgi:hypothetical protein